MNKLDDKELSKVSGGINEIEDPVLGEKIPSDLIGNYIMKKVYAVSNKSSRFWIYGTVDGIKPNGIIVLMTAEKTSSGPVNNGKQGGNASLAIIGNERYEVGTDTFTFYKDK